MNFDNGDSGLRVARTLQAFVQLTDTLVGDFDVIEMLTALAATSVDAVGAAAAGILVADDQGRLRVMAASSDHVDLLELFQIQNDEGACVDCFATGLVVMSDNLYTETRWPRFRAEAISAGFPSVCAIPLRLRDRVLGCLNLFMTDLVGLDPQDIAVGQALADVSSIAIAQDDANRKASARELRLENALLSRIVIEQAKGMIGEWGSLTMDEAFSSLRHYTRRHNLHLTDAAREVTEGRIRITDIVNPSPQWQPPRGADD
jgi:GAF domain-containing protein